MKAKIIKSTLGEVNHGRCGSRNNSRYSGRTPVWVVQWDTNGGSYCANRKWLADDFAAFINSGAWDGTGDPAMHFADYATEAGRRYLNATDSGAKLEGCFPVEEDGGWILDDLPNTFTKGV